MTEPISALALISNILMAIPKSLEKIRGTPKQRFAEELVSLLDILEEAEKATITLVDHFETFADKSDKEIMILAWDRSMFRVDASYNRFLGWIDIHSAWKDAIKILAPDELREVISRIYDSEEEHIFTFAEYHASIFGGGMSKTPLKPSQGLESWKSELRQLLSNIQDAQKALREFGRANLNIEDIYR